MFGFSACRMLFDVSLINLIVRFFCQLCLADQRTRASTLECVWLCSEGKNTTNPELDWDLPHIGFDIDLHFYTIFLGTIMIDEKGLFSFIIQYYCQAEINGKILDF